jgi:TolA-binding protein
MSLAQTTQPAGPTPATDAQKARAKQNARNRMARDANKKYTNEQLKEAEDLYQVANKNWRSDEARASLEKLVTKYPDLDRTGCGMLYLGQYSTGEQRQKYLKQAVEKFSDCYYGNGCCVGGYGRLLLGWYYLDNGNKDKAKQLFDELRKSYAEAIDHRGNLIVSMIPATD